MSDSGSKGARGRLAQAQRIVVKFGTHVVTHHGREFALGRVFALVEAIAGLRRAGKDVLVISSGAVGLGRRALKLDGPLSLGLRQACAAAGQGRLISLYTQAFAQLDVEAAQVLLTQDDLADPDRALCLRTTLLRLLELGAVPILNENDSVSVREIVEQRGTERSTVFGDNDGLSARVAAAVDADLLLLLTDVDGLYTANPRSDPEARRIPTLDALDGEAFAQALAGASGTSGAGTGGMRSKLAAARIACEAGVDVLIVDGHAERLLERALAGEDIGTLMPSPERRNRRRRRIALARCEGALVVNEGAIRALSETKASLLPIGVIAVEGNFGVGGLVELRDPSGLAWGRGMVNYDSHACRKLAGHHSREIDRLLGWRGYDALVTRDNLILQDLPQEPDP
ncbi:Glutamate 5-kinase [Enhygromyxa salina]|uniref:Glutamate 5-kinase n=1 Tax=Enhygromyxa salina TaxID=215803 RepID=A0A2S9XEU9_9BACT|nr:glutamate 5-kinase [Enhygromyxa salina]PRP91393.1 Glutamate 5-kinase [Enhygromyxa salina]